MNHKPFSLQKPSVRPARFAALLHQELTQLIPGSLRDPRLEGVQFITITHVDITPDLRNASIFFTLTESQDNRTDEVMDTLNQASRFLRRELMHRLNSKITPHLVFKHDRSYSNATQIRSLFKKLEQCSAFKQEPRHDVI
jgi:ribosome-binding factor A